MFSINYRTQSEDLCFFSKFITVFAKMQLNIFDSLTTTWLLRRQIQMPTSSCPQSWSPHSSIASHAPTNENKIWNSFNPFFSAHEITQKSNFFLQRKLKMFKLALDEHKISALIHLPGKKSSKRWNYENWSTNSFRQSFLRQGTNYLNYITF